MRDYFAGYSLPKLSRERLAKMRNPDDNLMYVVTDAPAIQNWLQKEFPSMTRFSPGIGVDPTNDLRDDHPSDADSRAKIAIDFKVQGWMDVSITLSRVNITALRMDKVSVALDSLGWINQAVGQLVHFLKRIKIKC